VAQDRINGSSLMVMKVEQVDPDHDGAFAPEDERFG
jgi:hypothetical protein